RLCVYIFVFYWSASHRVLHSFPTRRSSDLRREAALREEIQPLAVAREHRGTAFVAVAAQHGLATVGARDQQQLCTRAVAVRPRQDRKSTRLNSSHVKISYAVFCLKKKIKQK